MSFLSSTISDKMFVQHYMGKYRAIAIKMNKDNLCVGISTIECQIFQSPVICLSVLTAFFLKML
jgi:hypothetical protein